MQVSSKKARRSAHISECQRPEGVACPTHVTQVDSANFCAELLTLCVLGRDTAPLTNRS